MATAPCGSSHAAYLATQQCCHRLLTGRVFIHTHAGDSTDQEDTPTGDSALEVFHSSRVHCSEKCVVCALSALKERQWHVAKDGSVNGLFPGSCLGPTPAERGGVRDTDTDTFKKPAGSRPVSQPPSCIVPRCPLLDSSNERQTPPLPEQASSTVPQGSRVDPNAFRCPIIIVPFQVVGRGPKDNIVDSSTARVSNTVIFASLSFANFHGGKKK